MTQTMHQIRAEMEAARAAKETDAAAKRGALALKLFAAGVRHVLITFNGSGDSGQVDGVSITMLENKATPEWVRKETEDWVYAYLDGTGVDWYNDVGGFGEIEFDIPMWPGRFRAEVNQYETISTVAHSEEDVA
jgi:hypothetical protein